MGPGNFFGFKVLNFNICFLFFLGGGGGGFRKTNFCLVVKILWIFFGVFTKLDYI